MSNLTGFNVGANQRGILNLGSTINTPLSATLQSVTDGMGNASPLRLSTTEVAILSNSFLGASSATTNVVTLQSTTRNQIKIPSGTTMEFWYSAALEGMRLTSSGNLVVGTTTATARLHVRGDGTNPIARFENSSGASSLSINAAGDYHQYGSGNVGMFITNQAGFQSISGRALSWYSDITNLAGFGFRMYGNSNHNYTSGTGGMLEVGGNILAGAGSANFRPLSIAYTINNSGAQTGTATGIFLNATETALNGMGHNLIDLQVGGVSQFSVSRTGLAISVGGFQSVSGNNRFANLIINGGTILQTTNGGGSAAIELTTTGTRILYIPNLQFGGGTNAFPALKRNGAALEVRLADDSGFANISANNITANNVFLAGALVINSNGYIYTSVATNTRLNSFTTGFSLELNATSAIAASAILDLKSTTQGFLPPRGTNTQMLAIATPATGLMFYDTTNNKLNVYDGTTWQPCW